MAAPFKDWICKDCRTPNATDECKCGVSRAECCCAEIDPADVPCITCAVSEDLGIGPPPSSSKRLS